MRTALSVFSIAVCAVLAEMAWAEGGPKESTPDVIYDWSGIYVGGHIGRGWSGADTVLNGPEDLVDLYDYYEVELASGQDTDGCLAGGHIGVQRQVGRLVLGVEASLTGTPSGFHGGKSQDFEGGYDVFFLKVSWEGTSSFETEFKNLFTLTGRVGYAWDRWLGYLKGGYASAKVRLAHALEGEGGFCTFVTGCIPASPNLAFSSTEHHGGWVVGGGFEYMIHPSVVLGLEYNYVDLRAKTHKGFGHGDPYHYLLGQADLDLNDPIDMTVRVDPDPIHSVYARLSIKLGPELSSR